MSGYDLVRFGERGSFSGISHYEVQRRGDLIGTVWKNGPNKWFAQPYGEKSVKFRTLKAGCDYIDGRKDTTTHSAKEEGS